jgi:hypothetical protein
MAYSLLGLRDPSQWGIGGEGNEFQQFAGRFGDNVYGGMQRGMALGTEVTNYGTNQRLAGLREGVAGAQLNNQGLTAGMNNRLMAPRENAAREALLTSAADSQARQVRAGIDRRWAVCTAGGFTSPDCKQLYATIMRRRVAAQMQGQPDPVSDALGIGVAPTNAGTDMPGTDSLGGYTPSSSGGYNAADYLGLEP